MTENGVIDQNRLDWSKAYMQRVFTDFNDR